MPEFIALALLLGVATFVIVRGIMRLPSRYERRPKNSSPWNALDAGIDPSISDEPNS